MLFWTRALLCVGAATVLAIQHQPSASLPFVPITSAAAPADLVMSACRTRPDICAAAVTRGLTGLAPTIPAQLRTLRPAARANTARAPVAIASRSLT